MQLTKYSQLKHGMRVRCKINGMQVDDAKLSIDKNGSVYVCQNEEEGTDAEDKLGYLFSYLFAYKNDTEFGEVEDLESIDKSEWQAKYYKDDMWFNKDTVFIYGEELTVEGLKEKANAYRNILLAHNKKFPK